MAAPGPVTKSLRSFRDTTGTVVVGALVPDLLFGRVMLGRFFAAVLLGGVLFYFGTANATATAIVVVVICIASLVAESRLAPGRAIGKILRVLEGGVCGDCGYELVGKLSRDNVSENYTVGPPRCPECGSPWPLVPPPVPEWPQFK